MTDTANSTFTDKKESPKTFSENEDVLTFSEQAPQEAPKKQKKKEDEGEFQFEFRGDTTSEVALNLLGDMLEFGMGMGPLHNDACLIFCPGGKGPIDAYKASKAELDEIKENRKQIAEPAGKLTPEALGKGAKATQQAIENQQKQGQKVGQQKLNLNEQIKAAEQTKNLVNANVASRGQENRSIPTPTRTAGNNGR